MKMQQSAERFGAESQTAEVTAVHLEESIKMIETSEGNFNGRTVVIATGASHRHLGLENEDALIGRGLAYCAACDGMLYRGKTVAVVGGRKFCGRGRPALVPHLQKGTSDTPAATACALQRSIMNR